MENAGVWSLDLMDVNKGNVTRLSYSTSYLLISNPKTVSWALITSSNHIYRYNT